MQDDADLLNLLAEIEYKRHITSSYAICQFRINKFIKREVKCFIDRIANV